jgi:hypothetical protein
MAVHENVLDKILVYETIFDALEAIAMEVNVMVVNSMFVNNMEANAMVEIETT